jgi:hypothetical protein
MKQTASFLTALAVIILSLPSAAQSVAYKVVDNAPDKGKNLQVGVFIGGDFGDEILGNGIQANFNFKRFDIEGRYFRTSFSKITKDTSFPELIPPHKLELTAAFHLYDRVTDGPDQQLNIGGGYQTVTFIMVPVQVRKIRGLRGGLMDASTIETVHSKDAKGISTTSQHNIHVERIFGGLFTKRISCYKIAADNRSRSKRCSFEVFADFIFAPSIKVDPVYKGAARDISGVTTSSMGGRMGIQYLSARAVGLTYRVETGLMPGAARRSGGVGPPSSFYTSFTLGLDISAYVGKKRS